MNKYQLYTLGGALLAASSLSSMASAATQVGSYVNTTFTAGAIAINQDAFSATATTANAVIFGSTTPTTARNVGISFNNQYDHNLTKANPFKITIPASGASFTNIGQTSVSFVVNNSANGTAVTVTIAAQSLNTGYNAATAPTVSSIGGSLIISNVVLATGGNGTAGYGGGVTSGTGITLGSGAKIIGLILEGPIYTNASGLASGGSVGLGITVADNTGFVYESLASTTAAITGAAPLTTTITPGTTLNANGNATIAFSNFGSTSQVTLTLATVNITGNGTVGTDLTTAIDADGSAKTASTASVSVALANVGALTDTTAAPTIVINTSGGDKVLTALASNTTGTYTPAAYTSGTVTFTIAAASTYEGKLVVSLAYSGTTAISAATAGTAAVNYTAGVSSVANPPSAAAVATAGVSRTGLSTQIDWANSGTGSGYESFVRIHNNGSTAAPVTIVLKKDTTDGSATTAVATYTSPTNIGAGATVQIPVPAIEAGATPVLTPNANTSYTLLITAPFPGYVQHLSANTTSGALVDLDGFRNGGNTGP